MTSIEKTKLKKKKLIGFLFNLIIYQITPLTQAVKSNNIDIVNLLLQRNDILLNDEFGGIPLQIAVGYGSIRIVEMFLSHPNSSVININYKDEIFFNAFFHNDSINSIFFVKFSLIFLNEHQLKMQSLDGNLI